MRQARPNRVAQARRYRAGRRRPRERRIGTLRIGQPHHERPGLGLLPDATKSLGLIVETDNVHDFAAPDGEHLKS